MVVSKPRSDRALHRGKLTALVFQLVREQRVLLDRLLEPFGLTMQQAAILLRIGREGEIRPNRIAEDVGTDTAGITRLLDRLEAKQLVVRRSDPADRRSLIIALTDDGRRLAPRLGPIFASVERDLRAGYTAAEVDRAVKILTGLLDNVRKSSGSSQDGGR